MMLTRCCLRAGDVGVLFQAGPLSSVDQMREAKGRTGRRPGVRALFQVPRVQRTPEALCVGDCDERCRAGSSGIDPAWKGRSAPAAEQGTLDSTGSHRFCSVLRSNEE
jgi:hypothetical protein